MKPILFNTDMVRAILDGRKTATRRIVKAPVLYRAVEPPSRIFRDGDLFQFQWNTGETVGGFAIKPPYLPGDILYVRETWRVLRAHRYDANADIVFKAGGVWSRVCFANGGTDSTDRDDYDRFIEKWYPNGNWRPSIHMPKEAARIFLRVTAVRVERLKAIGDCTKEGIKPGPHASAHMNEIDERAEFAHLWDSTVKPADLTRYGWAANPWVWAVEFERCEKPEAET